MGRFDIAKGVMPAVKPKRKAPCKRRVNSRVYSADGYVEIVLVSRLQEYVCTIPLVDLVPQWTSSGGISKVSFLIKDGYQDQSKEIVEAMNSAIGLPIRRGRHGSF